MLTLNLNKKIIKAVILIGLIFGAVLAIFTPREINIDQPKQTSLINSYLVKSLAVFKPNFSIKALAQPASGSPARSGAAIDPCSADLGLFCANGVETLEGETIAETGNNIVLRAANILVLVGTSVAVLFIVINAFGFYTAQGDTAKIKKSSQGIIWSLVALVVMAASFGIVQFILRVIVGLNISG